MQNSGKVGLSLLSYEASTNANVQAQLFSTQQLSEDALAHFITDASNPERAPLVPIFADLKHTEAIPYLRSLLDDPEFQVYRIPDGYNDNAIFFPVRYAAANELLKLLKQQYGLLYIFHYPPRLNHSLLWSSPEAKELIKDSLASSCGHRKVEAIKAIKRIEDKSFIPLLEVLQSRDPELSNQIENALRTLNKE